MCRGNGARARIDLKQIVVTIGAWSGAPASSRSISMYEPESEASTLLDVGTATDFVEMSVSGPGVVRLRDMKRSAYSGRTVFSLFLFTNNKHHLNL